VTNNNISIPLHLAELLHVALGPLADVLESEGHRWAPMLKSVLDEYTTLRDATLVDELGVDAIPAIDRTTVVACQRMYDMVSGPVTDGDFSVWASELGGETV
jgi:hypothetical protein